MTAGQERVPVDQSARDQISRTGLARTIFVDAGAGSGKTTQLVDRIANLVLDAGAGLASIAAITFTEAAAAELQSRIRVCFEKRLAAAETAEERDRCRTALADTDLAAISTLHGFAYRLIGEFAVAAGLPPRITVLDEVASQLAREQRWERFVDGLYDDPANEVLLVRAAVLGVPLEPRWEGHATFKEVAVRLGESWDRLDALASSTPPPIGPVDLRGFDRAVDALEQAPRACRVDDDRFLAHLVQTVLPEARAIRDTADPNRKLRLLAGRKPWPRGNGQKGSWEDLDAAKALLDDLNDARASIVERATTEVLDHLLILVSREVLAAARARQEAGGLEFHDLLVLARDLLRRNPEVREILHDRYRHVLLDEFQDTDPIQIELGVLIAASIGEGDVPGTWEELVVEAGRLFFVGDPKQSIYRFRRADIELYLAARSVYGIDDDLASLTTNFRTVPPILTWVNAVFSQLMADEVPGRQPAYQALAPWRSDDSGGDHRPVLLGGPHPDPKVSADALRELEAADVAGAVADVLARAEDWPVDDGAAGWRPARLSDVTILLPTRTSLPFLRQALDQRGIPYRLATGTLVYDTQEVRDVLSVVRSIDDPTDELSLVAALRSPLYACSDVDLIRFRRAGGRWSVRADVPESIGPDDPVRLALAHLRGLWEQRWWLSPSVLVDRIVRERQAFLLGFGDPRPAEVWRRLRFLVDQARAFEEAGGGGLREFIDWAELQGADSARVHEPLLPETDQDSVQILTIHGAKGLEFPITVLTGLTTQPGGNRRGVGVLWDEEDEVPSVRIKADLETPNHGGRANLEAEMDVLEKVRLLYVATTRARDHLVISCHHRPLPRPTYAEQLWACSQQAEETWRRLPSIAGVEGASTSSPEAVGAPSGSEPGAVVADDRRRWITDRENLLAPQRTSRVVSATSIARSVQAELVDEDDDGSDLPDAAAVTTRKQGRAGTAIGRAVHATLQVLDLTDPDPPDLDAQVRRQCDIEAIPDKVKVVAGAVRSALASEAVALARSHPHHKELYVAAPVGERIVEGYVDLLVEAPEGLVVVDYKTDSTRTEAEVDAKLAAYELQGASYAVALERATGLPVVGCRFVFCRAGGAIEREVADLAAAKERVRSVVAR